MSRPHPAADPLPRAIAIYRHLDDLAHCRPLSSDEEAALRAARSVIERCTSADTEPPPMRRQSLRVPSSMMVSFRDEGGFARAYLRNISEGGVYVATGHPFEKGDRFVLTLHIASTRETLKLRVQVVWVNSSPSPQSGLEPGIGVAWLDLDPDSKQAIKSIVRRSLDDLG